MCSPNRLRDLEEREKEVRCNVVVEIKEVILSFLLKTRAFFFKLSKGIDEPHNRNDKSNLSYKVILGRLLQNFVVWKGKNINQQSQVFSTVVNTSVLCLNFFFFFWLFFFLFFSFLLSVEMSPSVRAKGEGYLGYLGKEKFK